MIAMLGIAFARSAFAVAEDVDWDFNRRSGFFEHQDKRKKLDKERTQGLDAWEAEQMQAAKQRLLDETEYRKNKKELSTSELGQGYRDYIETRRKQQLEYEQSRREEAQRKAEFERQKAKHKLALTEEKEYDVYLDRPKYEQRRRVLYGAKLKYGKSGTSSSSGGGSSGGYSGGSDNNFPAPPAFNEDFGDNFAPPPPPPPAFGGDPTFGDIPPPPPPPAFPDSFDGGAGDFVPPPPPFESFE